MKKSKVRALTKALAVVSLLAPASGHALGIGEIKLNSSLNQNLDAEIALTLSGESVSDIKVSLATPEKFDQAGVSWSSFLSKIKFEAVAQANGKALIKLTSREALKEPFLDFLLEVSWPKGSLYREFTVLVDPPSAYNPAPVATNTESYVQPSATLPQPRQSHANSQAGNGEYGPTLANDTLWSIAERARGQNDVSVEQMILALYEANPQAFYKANVYALTSGKTLKIPDRDAVLKLSRAQALAEFNRHTNAWKSHNAPVRADAAKEKPVRGSEKAADNQLTLLAPSNASVADNTVVAPATEQTATEKKTADAVKRGKTQVVPGQTDGVSSGANSADITAIQSKIADLEKQLAMMQELIALKDQQLAALQNQAQTNAPTQNHMPPNEAPTKPAEQAEQAAPVKPADQTVPVAQPAPAVSAQPIEQAKSVEQLQQPTELAKPAEPIKPVDPVKPTEPVKPAESVQQAKPAAPVQSTQPVVQQATSADDLYYWGVAGVGTAVLALLGGLWWRKRKVEAETNTESMFASTMINMPNTDENVSVPVVDNSVAVQDVKMIDESSFLSEFTPSDFDSFDTDQGEIDPISEADVYLAYGRYQQAEDLIRQAIKDQPNRDECKLKLLEIFYANESKEAFEAYAYELAEAGKRDELEFWEKATEMGREICPDSPLFSSEHELFAVNDQIGSENVVLENTSNDDRDEVIDESNEEPSSLDVVEEISEPDNGLLDLKADSAELEAVRPVAEAADNADIDFDLSVFSSDDTDLEVADDADKNSAPISESTEFDLSAFETEADVPENPMASTLKSDDIDFDLGALSLDDNQPIDADKSASAEIGNIDFDLSSFASEDAESVASGKNAQSSESIESIEFDLGAFSLDDKVSDDAEKKPAALDHIESIEFDLGAFHLDAKEPEKDKAFSARLEEIDFDLDAFSLPSTEHQNVSAPALQIEEIDFDLGAFSSDAKDAEKDAVSSESIEAIDFDLNSFSIDAKAAAEGDLSQKNDEKHELESLDFAFNFNEADSKDIGSFDFNATETTDGKHYPEIDFSGDSSLDFGSDFDFNFDLDVSSVAAAADLNEQGEFGVSDLTDMDEMETKLDLAKAYVDMGDAEAAKDIAKEVLEQGSDEQKKIAQALLDELN
ncbi:MAG: FimV/HubP family polar landmark protein [Methylobacter sp.]